METKPPPVPETINFDFVKTNDFRVSHADGAFLGLTQAGVMICFYSERQAIPKRIVHRVTPDGNVGEEIQEQRIVRDAIVRDVENAVIMNIEAAARFKDILDNMIRKHAEITKAEKK